jgi:hypothetical protein
MVGGPVASAWLHATTHGIYEAFINGARVGDEELRPRSPRTAADYRCRPTPSPT